MNKKDLKKYKKMLLEEKLNLIEQLNKEKIQIKDFSKVEVGDIVDKAYSLYEKNKTIDMSENQKKVLHAVDHALERIEKEEYGICTRCHKKINPARLDSIPWVATCMRTTCIPKKN